MCTLGTSLGHDDWEVLELTLDTSDGIEDCLPLGTDDGTDDGELLWDYDGSVLESYLAHLMV